MLPDMSRKQQIFILFVFLLTIAGIWYRQYRFFRSPLSPASARFFEEPFVSAGPKQDGIPALVDPLFESIAFADQYLDDRGLGLVVEVNGRTRFYPYQILVWHEVVNETFGKRPLLITYSPLTASGMVFERERNGEGQTFGVSGKLSNNNLLLYDQKTSSLSSQLMSQGKLTLFPSMSISWSSYKLNFPFGEVLSRETGFERDYTRNPYGDYETSYAIYFPLSHDDDRLPSKDLVFGVNVAEAQKSYSVEDLKQMGVVNDRIGSTSLVVLWDERLQTARAYRTNQGEREFTFRRDQNNLIDEQSGSVWNAGGEAISGPQRGERLDPIPLIGSYWFAWSAAFPSTELFVR